MMKGVSLTTGWAGHLPVMGGPHQPIWRVLGGRRHVPSLYSIISRSHTTHQPSLPNIINISYLVIISSTRYKILQRYRHSEYHLEYRLFAEKIEHLPNRYICSLVTYSSTREVVSISNSYANVQQHAAAQLLVLFPLPPKMNRDNVLQWVENWIRVQRLNQEQRAFWFKQ